MEGADLVLLYDYYGELLTDRQKECFELRYYQDLSLGEIGQELGISRQAAHDNLTRTEALLKNMEAKTGCVRRDLQCRRAIREVSEAAKELAAHHDPKVSESASRILQVVADVKE